MLMGRITLIMATTGLCALAAPAFSQGSLPDQLSVCARIAKKDARLACYDSVAGAASQGAYTSSFGSASIRTPEAAPPPVPGAPSVAAAPGFGAEQIDRPLAQRRAEAGDNEVELAVASARDNGLNKWQINMTDGAIWRMTETQSNFRPPKPNETVTIRKAALGSYLMQVGKQGSVRVERVR